MSDVSPASPPVAPMDPRYVAARRVLLDALTALAPHRSAVVLAGAQAVYLRTGDADIAVTPYTTDGDLALDPTLLGDDPALEAVMRAAGFQLGQLDGHDEPGVWLRAAKVDGIDVVVPVDLIVPEGAALGGGRRGARLGAHGRKAARRALGLEAALVDHTAMTVNALDPSDYRSIETEVAGTAALFVAKAHELHDRVTRGRATRIVDKDAADVVRLMQTSSPAVVGQTLARLRQHPIAGPPSDDATGFLVELFARRGRAGIEMASRALRIGMPEARIEALCTAYMEQLLAALRG